jgi:hypothetical protein
MTGAADGAAVYAGVGLPLASLPRFPTGAAVAFRAGGVACATWIGSTGFACSTRTKAFSAGGGAVAGVTPEMGTSPPVTVVDRR